MDLSDAIENLYRAFASYPLRPDMPACSCCTLEDKFDILVSVPLRDLSEEQLSHFAFSAISTWGELEDYKHFLPRILELAGKQEVILDIGLELRAITAKLKDNKWVAWPVPEQAALEAWFMALWGDILIHYQPGWDGYNDRQFLEHAAGAFDDLSPFLDKWAASKELPALLLLADFAINELGDLLQAKGGWQKIPQRGDVVRWFSDPARGEALDRGIERYIEDLQAETLATGLDFWRSMTGHAGG